MQDEIKHLNENIKECQKRELNLKDTLASQMNVNQQLKECTEKQQNDFIALSEACLKTKQELVAIRALVSGCKKCSKTGQIKQEQLKWQKTQAT